MSGRTSQRLFRVRLDNMVQELRNDIISGKYESGDFLRSETALAEQFDLSNKSVRQGLEVLVEEGLIDKIPRVGNRVKERIRESRIVITLGLNSIMERDIDITNLIAAFHRQYPSIQINTITIPGNSQSFIKEYVDYGLVDVFIINRQFFQELEENNLLSTLEPLVVKPETYRFLNETFTSNGHLYVQPLIFSPVVLCYNKNHFNEAELPIPDSSWTWEDCMKAARTISQQSGRYGLFFYQLSVNRWPAFLLQSGTKFEHNEQGQCEIANTRLLESIRVYDQLIHDPDVLPQQYLSENSDDSYVLFLKGNVSMILTTYMGMNEFKHADISYDVSTLPYLNEPRTLTTVVGAAVSQNSEKKQAAKLLVDHFSSEAMQRHIRQETLSIPASKPVAEMTVKNELNRPARYDLFRDILPNMRYHHDLNLTSSGFQELRRLLKEYWSRMIDDETLCQQIREKLTDKIKLE